VTKDVNVVSVHVEDIIPDPDQPRKTVTPDGLRGLTQSLQESGQISPILIRSRPDGKFTILVGERRWRAARDAGLSHVECIIRDDVDEQKAREMQLAENYQREDIPPLEQAKSFKKYLDAYGVSQSELSRRTGVPQRTISDRLALLSLPASVHARIESGELGPYEALKISALPMDQQEAVTEAVCHREIGGRELERLVRGALEFPRRGNKATQEPPQSVNTAETTTEDLLRRVENLEKAIYQLAETYAFNETSKETDQEVGKAPPCPECLRQGHSGLIRSIRRKVTIRDLTEWSECPELLRKFAEGNKEMPLKHGPTHVIEARCEKCGHSKFTRLTDK